MSNRWDLQPCLVTGGAGFGGAHLCETLLERGAKVYVLDRWLLPNSYLVLNGASERIVFITGDIRDVELVRLTLRRFEIETIFHVAAQPLVPLSNVLPLETLSVNALGTFAMLEAVRTAGCVKRFIYASSGAYYGTTTAEKAITEDEAPLPATNIYAPSKVAGDIAVRCYARVYGLRAAVCRFMNTYGPGDTNFSRIIPRAIKNLIDRAPYEFGDRDDGTTRLDYMYIGDMAKAYVAVAEHLEFVSGEAFNFGGGRPISTHELCKLVSRLFDGQEREPIFAGGHKDQPLFKCLETAKATQLLGWQAGTPLEQGLSHTIEWYRAAWDKL